MLKFLLLAGYSSRPRRPAGQPTFDDLVRAKRQRDDDERLAFRPSRGGGGTGRRGRLRLVRGQPDTLDGQQ